MKLPQIAIFASGNGSNAVRIIEHFQQTNSARVEFILVNRSDAGVLVKAQELNVKSIVCNNEQIDNPGELVAICKENNIDYIVLAGFLRKIPADLIQAYPEKIINIHPSLLPKYGGKGMYGIHVHRAVQEAKEEESGITIHFVNEEFDKGRIIAQHTCKLELDDTAESIQAKVQALEHAYFAKEIEKVITD